MTARQDYLFDQELLLRIAYPCHEELKSAVGTDYVMRPLKKDDHRQGYLNLLRGLTAIGQVEMEDFEGQFDKMKTCKDCYYVVVIEQISTQTVIGSSSLCIMHKFTHESGKRGRLEDVIVSASHRGKGLGKILVKTITSLSEVVGCYKMSLDCRDSIIPFYEGLGYKREPCNANTMVIRHIWLP